MALMRISRRLPTPVVPNFDEMENRMRKFLEGSFEPDLFPGAIGWVPPTEIAETETELLLTAELPGMEKKNIDISVDEGVLTIHGEKVEERKEGDENRKFHLFERNYGEFSRSFTLPRSVDTTKITADFDKGVLKVHLPKTDQAKAKGKKIEIGG